MLAKPSGHGCFVVLTILSVVLFTHLPSALAQNTEACCFATGCQNMPPTLCQSQGGTPAGPGTNCAMVPSPCTPPVCCLHGQCLTGMPASECVAQGGTPQPAGTVCTATLCLGQNCAPTSDAHACQSTHCPNATDKCRPKKVRWFPGGDYRILECDCGGSNTCHAEVVPGATPYCVGACPAGQACHRVETPGPNGSTDIECRCEPVTQDCAPAPDKKHCEPVNCPDPKERCTARCLNYNPQTGVTTVVACDCRGKDECHATTPCSVPDTGTGTAGLPPQGCSYETPSADMEIVDGLPAGSSIQIDSFFDVFADISVSPGGSLGGEIEEYSAMLHLPMQGTGDLATYQRNLVIAIQVQTQSGPRTLGDPSQSFGTDLAKLQGQITGDPDFDLLRITGGTEFGLPSPGHTTLTRQASGDWVVDSFFDITYRIDFVGSPGGPLAGRSGSTTGTIRVQTHAAPPDCVGGCPRGFTCVKRRVVHSDGSITICCDCKEDPPQECRPKPDGSACEETDCPDGRKCVPTAVQIGPDGKIKVTACDCRDPDVCHPEVVPGAFPFCQGKCPDSSQECHQLYITHADGSVEVRCECKPCDTDPDCDDGDPCTKDACDPDTGECVHTPVNCDDGDACTVDRCAPSPTGVGYICIHTQINCDDSNPCTEDFCVSTAAGGVACVHLPKDCDDGDPCTDDRCDPATGQCVHIPNNQCCGPLPDGSGCRPTQCPVPGQICRPVRVLWNPNSPTVSLKVLECRCGPEQRCHLTPPAQPGLPPGCAGSCPPGQTCEQIRTPQPDGSIMVECSCRPCTEADCDDGNACTQDFCDPATGGCYHTATVCSDGDRCTVDRCDPATGGCIFTPVDCDDHNPCTDDRCDPATGQCVHVLKNCDDNDPCTYDYCDQATGKCVHIPNDLCRACCLPDGTCAPLSANECCAKGGEPQPAGTNCANAQCVRDELPKFSQRPTQNREDIASNLDANDFVPNVVIADDFQSDGRRITSIRWWGSYINPEYRPKQFGGVGQSPFMIDGWLISFHRPIKVAPNQPPQQVLGLYFVPAEKVRITPTTLPACDGHQVFGYWAQLKDACLICSNVDPRNNLFPAQPNAFNEQRCFWYDLDIQAVVGRKWIRPCPPQGTAGCISVTTPNSANGNFWGWHMTDIERGSRRAVRGSLLTSTPPSLCLYGPWDYFPRVCTTPLPAKKRMNMAFEVLTDNPVVPPPCPKIIDWHIFYNGSSWGLTPATEKYALEPGYKATFDNISSHSRGLNGVYVDIQDLPGVPTVADFDFLMGSNENLATWVIAPDPSSITVTPGGGVDGSDRVSLIWTNNAIPTQRWLQLKVLPTAETGLSMEQEAYFGLLIGDTGLGTTAAAAAVTSTDYNATYAFRNTVAGLTSPYDFDRTKTVTSSDYNLSYAQRNKALPLITAP